MCDMCAAVNGAGSLKKVRSVYVAGPMRGYPDFNYPQFNTTAGMLRSFVGIDVFNPAENPDLGEDGTWEDYMALDFPMVCAADAVVLLPGWEKSPGANEELRLARLLKKTVFVQPDGNVSSFYLSDAQPLTEGKDGTPIYRAPTPKQFGEALQSAWESQWWDTGFATKDYTFTKKVKDIVYNDPYTVANKVADMVGYPNDEDDYVPPVGKVVGTPTRSKTILEEANELIFGDRNKSYGHPKTDYDATGKIWSVIINGWLDGLGMEPIPDIPADVGCLMMAAVKISRLSRNLGHKDSWTDLAGYAGCGWRVRERMNELNGE